MQTSGGARSGAGHHSADGIFLFACAEAIQAPDQAPPVFCAEPLAEFTIVSGETNRVRSKPGVGLNVSKARSDFLANEQECTVCLFISAKYSPVGCESVSMDAQLFMPSFFLRDAQ
jgi:hypothetical protein